MSEALLVAKGGGSTNSQKYQLMGDSGTRPNLPKLWVELGLTDAQGAPIAQVPRGQTLRFAGRVLDRPGGSLVDVNGAVSMLLEDSAPIDTTPDCTINGISCKPLVAYPFRAAPMFRGDVGVTPSGAAVNRCHIINRDGSAHSRRDCFASSEPDPGRILRWRDGR